MNAKVRLAAVLLVSALFLSGKTVWAADEKPAEKSAKPAAAAEKKSPADYRGPLPAYYNKVLSPDEKEKLYVITEKYAAQLKELQAKIKELETSRQKELDAALTPEQLARIKELRDEAAKAKTPAKPAAKPEAEKKPAEKKAE